MNFRFSKTKRFIDRDVPCVGCGYNLRTLGDDAVCPECGQEVDVSLREFRTRLILAPRPLEQSDPGWLLTLAIGASAVVVAIALSLVVTALPDGNANVLAYPIWIAAMYGHFAMTTPEPPAGEEKLSRRRLFILGYTLWPAVSWLCLSRPLIGPLMLVALVMYCIAFSFACQHYLVLIMVAERWNRYWVLAGCMGLMLAYLIYYMVGALESLDLLALMSKPLAGSFVAAPTIAIGSIGLPAHVLKTGGALGFAMLISFVGIAAAHIAVCARLWQAYYASRSRIQSSDAPG